jgi:hypothetical protein
VANRKGRRFVLAGPNGCAAGPAGDLRVPTVRSEGSATLLKPLGEESQQPWREEAGKTVRFLHWVGHPEMWSGLNDDRPYVEARLLQPQLSASSDMSFPGQGADAVSLTGMLTLLQVVSQQQQGPRRKMRRLS